MRIAFEFLKKKMGELVFLGVIDHWVTWRVTQGFSYEQFKLDLARDKVTLGLSENHTFHINRAGKGDGFPVDMSKFSQRVFLNLNICKKYIRTCSL